jgi:hypothetical protein
MGMMMWRKRRRKNDEWNEHQGLTLSKSEGRVKVLVHSLFSLGIKTPLNDTESSKRSHLLQPLASHLGGSLRKKTSFQNPVFWL